MTKILRKTGWTLNPDDKVVNAVLGRVALNNGECPCVNPGTTPEDRLCPCREYRENNICHCNLYVRKNEGLIYRCFACGGELIWGADFMESELDGCDESEDTIVNVLHCKDCGATVEVYHNRENETEEE